TGRGQPNGRTPVLLGGGAGQESGQSCAVTGLVVDPAPPDGNLAGSCLARAARAFTHDGSLRYPFPSQGGAAARPFRTAAAHGDLSRLRDEQWRTTKPGNPREDP